MKDTIKITYIGELDEDLDKDLNSTMLSNGYEFLGSGYDFTNNTRDLCFAVPQQEQE